MRKPRDIDAELKALQDKQKALKSRKISQLGELVLATGADAIDPETLAGALLDAVRRAGAGDRVKETWRQQGEGFFRRERRSRPANGSAAPTPPNRDSAAPELGAAAPG